MNSRKGAKLPVAEMAKLERSLTGQSVHGVGLRYRVWGPREVRVEGLAFRPVFLKAEGSKSKGRSMHMHRPQPNRPRMTALGGLEFRTTQPTICSSSVVKLANSLWYLSSSSATPKSQ